MARKMALAISAFLTGIALILFCAPNENPFVPTNATVTPVVQDTAAHKTTNTVSDTVGNQIFVGFVPYLVSYIDSVRITVASGANTDTVCTFDKRTPWTDTVWLHWTFQSPGTRTITFSVFVGSQQKTVTASLVIYPRTVHIVAAPSNGSVLPGDSITLSAGATGPGTFTYQWYKDTAKISGAALSSYTILNFQSANAGSYTCLIRDQWGDTARTTAAVLSLTVVRAVPKWSHDSITVNFPEGSVGSFNLNDSCITVSGATISYRLKNGGGVGDTVYGSVWKYSPTYSDSGSYVVTIMAVTATDSSLLTMFLHVANVNRPPQFDAGKPVTSYSVKGGAQLSFDVNATDPDNDAVSYFIKSSTLPRTSPALSGKTVTWQSLTTDSANAAIVIGANDWKDTTFITVQVAVGKVNAAPSLGGQSLGKTVSKGQTLRVLEGDSVAIAFTVTDPDSLTQTHVLKILDRTPLSCGTVVFDSVNARFMFKPSFTCANKDSLLLSGTKFVVTDNGAPPLSDTLPVNFNVINVNRAPALIVLHDTAVFQSKALLFIAQAVDPDGDAVTISASGLAGGALPDSAHFDPKTGQFSWTPLFNQTGVYSIVFTASDGKLTDKDTTTITVHKTDRAPVFNSIPAQVQGAAASLLKLYVKATDPDGDAVTLTTSGTPFTKGAAITADTLRWTPGYGDTGSYRVLFVASDGLLADTDTTTIVIRKTDRAPVFNAIPAQVAGAAGSLLKLYVKATDPDGDAVTLTTSGTPFTKGAAITADTLRWTPGYGDTGSYRVLFIASDGTLADTDTTTIVVRKTDRAPAFNTIPAQVTGSEGSVLKLYVKATDPDGDAVTLTTSGTPFTKGAAITADTLRWTPGYSDSGSYAVLFMASDGTLIDTVSTVIKIANVDRPPLAVAQSVGAGRNTAKTINLSATDPDTDQIKLFRISKGATNGTAVFSDSIAGTVVYTPNSGFIGKDSFAFIASDGSLWSLAPATVSITVDSSKVAPKISALARTDTTINQGGTFNFIIQINNAFPSPTYSWYQGTKPGGALKNTGTSLTYSKSGVASADSGNYYVVAINSAGTDTSGYSHLNVNVPPVIQSRFPAKDTVSQNGSLQLHATVNADVHPAPSYVWTKNGGATSVTSGTYSIGPAAFSDSAIYKVTVSNAAGQDTESVLVLVKDTTTPSINLHGSTDTTILIGSTWSDPATASDARDGDITAKISKSPTVVTTAPAKFVVNYNVSDNWGNAAPSKTRTVRVVGWVKVGSDLSGTDFGTAMTANGDLYVSYIDPLTSALHSKMVAANSTTWQNLSDLPVASNTASSVVMDLDTSGMYPVAGYKLNDNEAVASCYKNGSWISLYTIVGSGTGNNVYLSSFNIDHSNNYPTALSDDYGGVTTQYIDPNYLSWLTRFSGDDFTIGGHLFNINSFMHVSRLGRMFASYIDGSNNFTVRTRAPSSDSSWNTIVFDLATGMSPGSVLYNMIMIDTVPVIYATNTQGYPTAWKYNYNGNTWSTLGNITYGSANLGDITCSAADGKVYTAYTSAASGKTDSCYVQVYQSGGWYTFPSTVNGLVPLSNVVTSGGKLKIQVGNGVYYVTYLKSGSLVSTMKYVVE